jgi:hypothetical protein
MDDTVGEKEGNAHLHVTVHLRELMYHSLNAQCFGCPVYASGSGPDGKWLAGPAGYQNPQHSADRGWPGQGWRCGENLVCIIIQSSMTIIALPGVCQDTLIAFWRHTGKGAHLHISTSMKA